MRFFLFAVSVIFAGQVLSTGARADSPTCLKFEAKRPAVAGKDTVSSLQAIQACKEALKSDPENGRRHYGLAKAYFKNGLKKSGLKHLKDAAKFEYARGQFELFQVGSKSQKESGLTNEQLSALLVHAAAQGLVDARYALAIYRYKGKFVPENKELARREMKQLADEGYRVAKREYGKMLALTKGASGDQKGRLEKHKECR